MSSTRRLPRSMARHGPQVAGRRVHRWGEGRLMDNYEKESKKIEDDYQGVAMVRT